MMGCRWYAPVGEGENVLFVDGIINGEIAVRFWCTGIKDLVGDFGVVLATFPDTFG
jgi:hypothetical protein